ncbi:UDP-N-acetylglucosamine 1-carboxyvinyltransferase [Candidatus Kaiserbacteria bacterium RIFCSPLOWO2_02_FULL_45_11b]|uniref:UDP-N-acetylglucosamine 1-carboxyvinyltransferase n=1 Tax=Candidatus Kaiserbacteria bacterium RIFCSPLOWO2_12_FULL_45_26 TaxID=1798525 RepID=A0A1F6FH75_9BACT|nr:MAG: UDP-N-acetylglucosamine 1-carboxyvinyltransferase [Candidatus Kaiserbacteria bacterium RIFCSPHIGHO2_12_45_16]OGG70849.1 MAG: UDP-N-acetylglucosamine 1-carboxyvinyltransferase [Candidatus Kaiserbacteria bacterium RIFCSPLOWO2_01_FULL_45_25]OGG83716.1 MAG: UDP-N-acetylglucosamine 1-carboxyvinyltransferase [Candidatus Kaiserbacteria bacterium RIFCSPLOWO2_02_FULL_45_11b]OGG85211.1 MAG: UDP-N-acetylglucosamine 1-carboxyvinyltransferase [Candidatus Kaiserbacteria bacterium RIFCSPLOWO2_12_FULL_4
MTNIGHRIADMRETKGITQAALAKKLKTTQSAIARIESGKQNISADMLKRIGQALGKNLITLSPGTVNIQIEGNKKLSGTIETNTSKNGAVGLLCASLLNRGTTTLHHMPRIEEVHRIIEVLESIGVRVEWKNNSVIITPPKKFSLQNIDVEAARKTRSIVMFIGSLIHTLPQFSLPQSGGCKLGSRTVRPHFYALENFGVTIDTTEDAFKVKYAPKSPQEIILYESGDTVTENALFAAAGHTGTTTIKYASANYMVQEICVFLQALGVQIDGIGTTTLTVTGLAAINTNIEYTLAEDPTDSMFFIAAAIITNSNITITRCPIEFLELELLVLQKMGLDYTVSKPYFSHNGRTKLADVKIKASKLIASPEKIHSRPYPGLNADNLPFFAVIATQAEGQTLIHDWMYEKRAIYFTELDKLGADTVLADPHRIYITGPTPLKATELICPPALRPATILLIAMLGAKGTSVLRNIYSINRGYEKLIERLSSIGASVSYLDEF